MIVAGPEGFVKGQYRKFNIRSADLSPGDDYGMMREVLRRRFKRLLTEAPRAASVSPSAHLDSEIEKNALAHEILPSLDVPPSLTLGEMTMMLSDGNASPWPDLLLIDGGQGQLNAARETLAELGIVDLPLAAIAKGVDRDAGQETFFLPGRPPLKLRPRDPLLYFVQRLRDEAHRFAIGSHRQRRKRDIREAGLQEIAGIGPTRKRALLRHFGTLKAIERATIADLAQAPGINAETARKIHDFFHGTPA
jgi:excinuclease ABC subunit C